MKVTKAKENKVKIRGCYIKWGDKREWKERKIDIDIVFDGKTDTQQPVSCGNRVLWAIIRTSCLGSAPS